MTTDLDTSTELLDSRQDHRWVWSAMHPADRRQLLDRMVQWVDWLVGEYDHLATQIPPCWFRHAWGRNELTALYVAWVRVYVEPGENQRETALVEWHDALARVMGRVKFPVECLENGEHFTPYTKREPWATDSLYAAWAGTDPEMTGGPAHPAPYYQPRPKPAPGQPQPAARAPRPPAGPAETVPAPAPAASPLDGYLPDALDGRSMRERIAEGSARQLNGVNAVQFSGSWWTQGEGGHFVRLNPSNPEHVTMIRNLDAAGASLV